VNLIVILLVRCKDVRCIDSAGEQTHSVLTRARARAGTSRSLAAVRHCRHALDRRFDLLFTASRLKEARPEDQQIPSGFTCPLPPGLLDLRFYGIEIEAGPFCIGGIQ